MAKDKLTTITEALNNIGYNVSQIDEDEKIELSLLFDAIKWLINKHQMVVSAFIAEPFAEPIKYVYSIQSPKFGLDNYSTIVSDEEYDTYEDALNEGILRAANEVLFQEKNKENN